MAYIYVERGDMERLFVAECDDCQKQKVSRRRDKRGAAAELRVAGWGLVHEKWHCERCLFRAIRLTWEE